MHRLGCFTFLILLGMSMQKPLQESYEPQVKIYSVDGDIGPEALQQRLANEGPPGSYLQNDQSGVQYQSYVFENVDTPPNHSDIIREARKLAGGIFDDVDVIEEIVPVQPDYVDGSPFIRRIDGIDYANAQGDLLDDLELDLKPDFYNSARKRRIRFNPVFHG